MKKLVVFSKMFKDLAPADLIRKAHALGADGWDLCVRAGHPVTPDTVSERLPNIVRQCRAEGLDVPMLTGEGDLLSPEQPSARPILAAMDRADVRLLKLGYFTIDPAAVDYAAEVTRVRRLFAGWQKLAREHGVKVCYHTHSHRCMGLNGAALAHLLDGFDPHWLGAYLDPGHLVYEGEAFETAAAMVRPYLSIVSMKDFLLSRVEKNGHGSVERQVVEAGQGMVDWTVVFEVLRAHAFGGPLTVHCEFDVPRGAFMAAAAREVRFFRRFVPAPGRADAP